jgi:transcriptional regulator with XRE-family HTH domain
MASVQGPVVQSLLLRNELVWLRKAKGLTQEQVARDLEWSPARLIRIEGGKTTLTKTDLQALLAAYGITSPGRIERLQDLARGARERAWWSDYRGDFPDAYLSYVGYEAGASFIRQTQNSVVPGLLQTREYAEAYTSGFGTAEQVGLAVRFRLRRQEEMSKRVDPPQQFYILDEAVIRRHVGIKADPGIMPAQLQRLVEAGLSDHITIVVIPFAAGAHAGMDGPFTLLEFDGDLGDILYAEGPWFTEIVTGDDGRIAEQRDAFETLRGEALSPEKSLELIHDVAEEMVS